MRPIIAVSLAAIWLISVPLYAAGDGSEPWSEEKAGAQARCEETFDDYQLQAVCMKNEKDGYEQMQEAFGLPSDLVDAAKARCAETFDSFSMQATCLENEKKGYEEMQRCRDANLYQVAFRNTQCKSVDVIWRSKTNKEQRWS